MSDTIVDWRTPMPGQIWERNGRHIEIVTIQYAVGNVLRPRTRIVEIYVRWEFNHTLWMSNVSIEEWRRWCKPLPWSSPPRLVGCVPDPAAKFSRIEGPVRPHTSVEHCRTCGRQLATCTSRKASCRSWLPAMSTSTH